jgi:hypothetical protein
VLQVRVQNTMPESIGPDVIRVLHLRREALEHGALVTIDKVSSRVRILPLNTSDDPSNAPVDIDQRSPKKS